jgi:Carboxypeptidase regulatory-like domain
MKVHMIAALLLVLQQTATSIQQQPAPKSSIEGTVVRIGTAEPIPGARVTLTRTGANPSEAISVSADFQGKFIINDLDADSFLMDVAANGYARQAYGQRFAGGPGMAINLAAGQIVKNVVIALTPAGYVNGNIRDDAGSPAAGLLIQLFRATYNGFGQKVLRSAGTTTTNDRGEYRLYWVTPGRYYLAARSAERLGLPLALDRGSPNAVQERYALTYYPGALDVQEAAVIDVQPGANLTAIDFTVSRQQQYTISGRVIDSRSGQSPRAVTITTWSESATGESEMIAFSRETTSFAANTSYNTTDGTFEIRNVASGSYVVKAQILGESPDARPGAVPSASAAVMVSNSDIVGLTLNIGPAVSISGRLTIEGRELSTVRDFESIRIRLLPTDLLARLALPNSPQSQTLNPDGTFRLDNVQPGQYQVLVCLAGPCIRNTPDFYLKDARFDHVDVLNRPLQFASIASTPLEIVLSPKPGKIEGVVVNDKRQPVAGIRTILIPEENRDRIGLYKFAETDQSGHFTIRGITPGAYKVFAWEALEEFAYFDPDLMQRFEPYGTRIRVSESDELSTEVKLIPAAM